MAASSLDSWTVMILVGKDKNLEKNYYPKAPLTSLAELMKDWKSEFSLVNHWVFKSVDETIEYDDHLVLHEIGATIPNTKIITLKAEISDKPRSFKRVFRYLNNDCHQLLVNPDQELHEVLPSKRERHAVFECNCKPLCLRRRMNEASLENKAVISESSRPIVVKLSSGESRTFRVPANCLVQHLMEKIYHFEKDTFSLLHSGRHLHPQESIIGLQQTVHVNKKQFIIHFDATKIIRESSAKSGAVPELLCHPTISSPPDEHETQIGTFQCVGCQRYIFQTGDDRRSNLTECREEKLPSERESDSMKESLMKCIANLCEQVQRDGDAKSRTETLRHENRLLKDACTDGKLDYNEAIRLVTELQRKIVHRDDTKGEAVDDKITALQTNQEELPAKTNTRYEGDTNPETSAMTKRIEKEVLLLRSKIDNLETIILGKKAQINDLKRQNDEKKARISELERMENEKDGNIACLQINVYERNSKISNLERMNNEKDTKIAEIEKVKHEQSTKLASLKGNLTEKMEAIDKLESNIVRKEAKIANLEGMATSKDTKIATLENVIAEKKILFTKHEKTIQTQKHIIIDLENMMKNINCGVKLIVYYDAYNTSPVLTRPEVQQSGRYPWSKAYIKCWIPGLVSGMTSYVDLRSALQPLFNKPIHGIQQLRTIVNGTEITEVTLHATDEDCDSDNPEKEFCSANGQQWSWAEAGKPTSFVGGNELLICGGGRRTILIMH